MKPLVVGRDSRLASPRGRPLRASRGAASSSARSSPAQSTRGLVGTGKGTQALEFELERLERPDGSRRRPGRARSGRGCGRRPGTPASMWNGSARRPAASRDLGRQARLAAGRAPARAARESAIAMKVRVVSRMVVVRRAMLVWRPLSVRRTRDPTSIQSHDAIHQALRDA